MRVGLLQFVDLRGGGGSLARKSWVMISREEVVILFFINKNVFFSFSFLFCDEISNNYNRNLNQSKTRIGDQNMSAELHV